MAIKAIQLPDGDVVRIEQMANARHLNGGVGIYDMRKRMVGWIKADTPEKARYVLTLLLDLINSPHRGVQPDWEFLYTAEGGVDTAPTLESQAGDGLGEPLPLSPPPPPPPPPHGPLPIAE